MSRGRPTKSEEQKHKIKRNVRLLLKLDKLLIRISDRQGIPPEVLLRSYVNEGIRRDVERLEKQGHFTA